jgi:hypothetical protein
MLAAQEGMCEKYGLKCDVLRAYAYALLLAIPTHASSVGAWLASAFLTVESL